MLHVPPAVASDNKVVVLVQIPFAPLIAAGSGFTVAIVVFIHPVVRA